jgi:hypothetical protein
MAKFLLAVHVLAAILLVGPVAVAASLFPRFATPPSGDGGYDVAALLHRICRSYAAVGVVVPVFGIATAARLGVLTDAWLVVSVVLTAAAAAVLGLRILPAQRRLLDASAQGATGLMTATGVFNLLWAVVVVLMILRPGSTTGA